MKKAFTVLFCLLLWGSSTLFAQWYEDGRPVQDRPWRKSHKEFRAMVLLTTKPQEFLEAWDKPSSPDYKPAMETAASVVRGQPIVAFILFAGCKPDSAGKCESTTEFEILKPDGSQYDSVETSELWTGKEPPPASALQLGVAYVGVVIEPEDPLGDYTVTANVCDRVADRCLVLSTQFTAVESTQTESSREAPSAD